MRTSKRNAISPILATVILIAITIAGGLLVYNVFFSSSNTAASTSQVEIVGAQLVAASDGSASYSVTFKDSGSKPITGVSAFSLGGQNIAGGLIVTPSSTAPLSPGVTDSAAGTLPSGFVIGNSYPILLTVTFSDGSHVSTSLSVAATS